MSSLFCVGIATDPNVDTVGLMQPVLDEVYGPLPHVEYDFFAIKDDVVTPDEIEDYDGIVTFGQHFTSASFSGDDRLAVIARWGAGYDMIVELTGV